MRYLLSLFILIGLLVFIAACGERTTKSDISFNNHIRPILSDKCFACHGPDAAQRQADFRLDTEQGALAKLTMMDGFGIIPGDVHNSEVYKRIISTDPSYMMPPPESNLQLTTEEKELIKQWINQGALYQKHWAFMPITKPDLPRLKSRWPRNEIDYFVLERMTGQGFKPNVDEKSHFLLRRMMHDITGLPPNAEEQDIMTNDGNPDEVYERLVDKALSSEHYGERMAIMWMDIARYADSHGYQDDGLRTMWPWRDWVIHAFNENYPYDQFITWQMAGDLIPEPTKETLLATGFNRNHKITQEGGVIDEEYRIEYVTDRTNTFGKSLLAMTFECAKCHDHKYDPISQEEYFSSFAFFNQVPEKGLVGDISLFSLADPPYMSITQEDRNSILNFISKLDTGDVRVMIMQDSPLLRQTYVLARGEYDKPTQPVSMAMPRAILPFDTLKYPSNRLGLAQWMFDEDNPLTARVFVNLVWQEFFGQGIVATVGDFGLQGDVPTNPELLDWLASDFRENGYDIKRLIKQIVMSSTYRQSQEVAADKYAKDPENTYLARGPRIRLSAELIKDHVLSTSGLLNPVIGGASVKPYQPDGLWESATSGRGQLAEYIQDKGDNLYRRGLYHFIKRTVPPPSMLIFDASNRDQCEVKRSTTSTPLQALVMMNDPQILEASRFFAQRLIKHTISGKDRIHKAFKTIVCREPSQKELKAIMAYHDDTARELSVDTASKLLNVGEIARSDADVIETAALMQTIHLIYNLEESSMR